MAEPAEDDRGYRRRTRAWALYDVANSSFYLVVVTAIFPIFYQGLYAGAHGGGGDDAALKTKGGAALALTAALAMVAVAVLGPILGAVADRSACKKRFLAGFAGLGVLSTAAMALLGGDDWVAASVLYALGTVGVSGSIVFYDALLPSVAREGDLDRVSTFGFAAGYLGSVVLFGADIALVLHPEWFGLTADAAPRAVFLSVAAWWALFTIPLLRRVPEPPAAEGGRVSLVDGFRRVAGTFREALGYRDLLLFLIAFWIYSDGIGTIIKLSTPFGNSLGIGKESLVLAILLSNLIGVPCALGFGRLAKVVGAKRAILGGLVVYMAICVFARFLSTAAHFYVLAAAVGTVQGGTQALSRSLYATLVPRGRSGEFFGFFSTMEKFAGLLGPLVLALYWSEGEDPRRGVSALVVFFLVGALLLWRVDVARGRERARA
jgi:UMF1 family MFS transporter